MGVDGHNHIPGVESSTCPSSGYPKISLAPEFKCRNFFPHTLNFQWSGPNREESLDVGRLNDLAGEVLRTVTS